jgi:hypothetical protein
VQAGVTGVASDPKLLLYYGDKQLLSNDDWHIGNDPDETRRAAKSAGAFEIAAPSKDSAILVYLEPGVYTAQLSSGDGTPGVALIEVYEIP